MTKINLCKCGSKNGYDECCAPFINGSAIPDTPEKLMRSRYSAYALGCLDYILTTMQGKALAIYNESNGDVDGIKWLKLEVLDSYLIDELHGVVEFKAWYRYLNKKYCQSEVSLFEKINERWYYIDAKE